jgi:hypothetical protein
MTTRVCLGWRVLEDEWDAFVTFVEEKWGCTDGYLRFELEAAMREWLDRDEILHEAEELLRGYVDARTLSSSSDAVSGITLTGETRQLGYRVQEELKEEFKKFASQRFDENVGLVLSRALNTHRDGGRRQRVLDLVHQLVGDGSTGDTTGESDENAARNSTGRDTTSGSDENEPRTEESSRDTSDESDENARVDAMAVADIASEWEEPWYLDDLHALIAKRVAGDGDTIALYTDAVTNYENLVEHPVRDGLFIPEETRANLTVYGDLDRDGRADALRTMLTAAALRNESAIHSVEYGDVQDLFEEEYSGAPSDDYAYTLMEDAADAAGFEYCKSTSPMQLRVDIREVANDRINQTKSFDGVDSDLVDDLVGDETVVLEDPDADELDDAEVAEPDRPDIDITSFSAGPTPQQEAGADD